MEQGKKKNLRAVGASYEKTAGEYLRKQGYEILCFNFSCRFGEIDIVAKDHGTLVFVEVKYRRGEAAGNPLEAVTIRKQRAISKSAGYYCCKNRLGEDCPCRFDVVAFLGKEITHMKNAFAYQI